MTIPFAPDPTAECSCGGVIEGGTHSEFHRESEKLPSQEDQACYVKLWKMKMEELANARVCIEELERESGRIKEENGRMKTFLETEAIQIIFSEGTSGSEFAVAYSQKSLNALMVSLTPNSSVPPKAI